MEITEELRFWVKSSRCSITDGNLVSATVQRNADQYLKNHFSEGKVDDNLKNEKDSQKFDT